MEKGPSPSRANIVFRNLDAPKFPDRTLFVKNSILIAALGAL
jgi:hypothetical protein